MSKHPSPCHQSPSKQASKSLSSVLQIFNKTRDTITQTPYHLDGNIQMYSQQKINDRSLLQKDQDIRKQIQIIVSMYPLNHGKILEKQYKSMQKKIAFILRPDLDQHQLDFIVDEDWKLDQSNGAILPADMIDKIFQLVDVWTLGIDKSQYITFIRLLSKKLSNSLK